MLEIFYDDSRECVGFLRTIHRLKKDFVCDARVKQLHVDNFGASLNFRLIYK